MLLSGNEKSSPFNVYREYTIHEISSEIESELVIGEEFNASITLCSKSNMILVNGMHIPTVEVYQNNTSILRIVHAAGGGPLALQLQANTLYNYEGDSSKCIMSVIAWDGVYLESIHHVDPIYMSAAARADVQIRCVESGVYTMYSGEIPVFDILVRSSPPEYKNIVTNEDLGSIVRPSYLQDLTEDTIQVDVSYSIVLPQSGLNATGCVFGIGTGADCSSRSENGECSFVAYEGTLGVNKHTYLDHNKIVLFESSVNEFVLYGYHSAYQPFHISSNHMQIVSSQSSDNNDISQNFYLPGQWRDTIPLVSDSVSVRFRTVNNTIGEHMMNSCFKRHDDLGMRQSYLIINSTYFFQGIFIY
jgi:FtsP/CotA-like multicopper oxidase with cupredoxin domain